MSITKIAPRTVLLTKRNQVVIDNEYHSSAAITPGMLVEYHDSTGIKIRPNASATEVQAIAVALDQPWLNEGITDDYASGDLVTIAWLQPGCVFLGIIPSGQDISFCELLKSNADGKLQSASTTTADANLGRFQSLEAPGAVTVDTRLRVQYVG